jgi:Protein of unknown function (DUF3124)
MDSHLQPRYSRRTKTVRVSQTLSGGTGILVLLVCLVAVAGPSSAERSSPSPTTTCTAGEAAYTLGQKIYVPAYSHIYYQNQKRRYPLAVTLSIRNTDEQHPLKVTSTRYVGTEGQVLKEYVETPIHLGPLASIEFFVDEQDKSGGLGASFLVEWVAEQPVYGPVVEAVLVGTAGTQAISFVSTGRVLCHRSP